MIKFRVNGKPVTQGSKRAFVRGKHAVMIEDRKDSLMSWRSLIADEARKVYDGDPIEGPLYVSLEFIFSRPKGHYGTGRNAGRLKDSAPMSHTTKPDLDKLTRAVGDALSGVLWRDDSQIEAWMLSKQYGDRPGVEVIVGMCCQHLPSSAFSVLRLL